MFKATLMGVAVVLGLAGLPVVAAPADTYPSRPVRILVGFAAGGAVDIVARALGDGLSRELGQSFIVEPRPGAGSNLAAAELARSEPDGGTLMLGTNGLAINMSLYARPGFDVSDLQPVSKIGEIAAVVAANPSFAANSIADLVSMARSRPGEIIYGSPGNGSSPHLAAELFARVAGFRWTHAPYRGGTLAITDVIGGHIPIVVTNVLEATPQIKAGTLKALGVTSPGRLAMLPDVPTIAESGFPGYATSTWYGLFSPGRTPPDIVAKLNAAARTVLADPRFRATMEAVGGEVSGSTPAELGAFVAAERARWADVIRDAHIKID